MSERPHAGMVLAAGLGLRMRPLTEHLPKPLVEVAGRPLIEYTLELLERQGIEQLVVNASYLAPKLEAYFKQRQGGAVSLSFEEERLETGGGVARALPLLGDAPFYVMNSDVILCDGTNVPALERLAEAWDGERMDALLLLMPKEKAIGYDGEGDFFLENGCVRRRGDAATAPYVFTGTQLLHPRLFTGCPQGAFSLNVLYDRSRDGKGALQRVGGIVHDGKWLHVGDPDGKRQAEEVLHTKKAGNSQFRIG